MIKWFQRIILLLGVGATASIAFAGELNEIWNPTDEGWYDLTLKIQDIKKEKDGDTVVKAYGLFKGKKVGLAVSFRKGMKPGITNNDIDKSAFAKNGITFLSIGPESDALINSMAELYKVNCKSKRFVSSVSVTSFALSGNPLNIMKEGLKFKVFFNDAGTDDNYAELFVNIDVNKHVLELFEKDEEYRENVVKALCVP